MAVKLSLALLFVTGAFSAACVADAQASPAGPREEPVALALPGTVHDRSVTVLVVPGPVLPEDLSVLPGTAIGVMSPGLGEVPPDQTWLDASQGARAFDSKYDAPLNTLSTGPGFVFGWGFVVRRAASPPIPLKPGLLAATLRRNSIVPASAQDPSDPDPSSLAIVTPGGFIKPASSSCPGAACEVPVTVSTAGLAEARRVVAARQPGELVIVVEAPPVASGEQLAIAVAGTGFDGMLRSPSTRTPGYVLSTDLAPTILAHFGIPRPAAMTGLRIRSGGEVDFDALADLEGRYQQVGERKATALLFPLLAWLLITGAVAAFGGRRRAAVAVSLLCLSVILLPAVLLLTAAISPSSAVESAIAGLLPVAVAVTLLRLLPGWRAPALACALTVSVFALDLVAGLSLTQKAVIGPNPGLGARFYGIGNELESTLMILTSVGTGAAIQAWAPGMGRRGAAALFLGAGLAGTVIFASGRFGADVGAAIIFPLAAVVGAALAAGRPRLIWLGAVAAAVCVALLALADTLTGGETHFVRSVFDGGSTDSVLGVLGHRLEATWDSFASLPRLPFTLLALLLALLAWRRREWLSRLFEGLPFLRAGMIAAASGSLVGALTNDSGALFLQVGALYLALMVAFTWAADTIGTDP